MKFLIPEVIQTSAMDCGPAALKALMEGFGLRASYGRLREACHTDVDGTSIDTIEEMAVKLGLQAEQVLVPVDHLILEEAQMLPAMVVTKLEGSGTHFVVAWRRHGAWLQLMDPASGRRWVRASRFLQEVHVHSQQVPADAWFEWASTGPGLVNPLKARMRRLGASHIDQRLAAATKDWLSLATLDAAVHLAESLGEPSLVELVSQPELIPPDYWRVVDAGDGEVVFRGAVALRCSGVKRTDVSELPQSLREALTEKPLSPVRELWSAVRASGLSLILAAFVAIVLASAGVLVEAILLRSLFSVTPHLPRTGERFTAVGVLLAFLASMAFIEWAMEEFLRASGRGLEVRLRTRFGLKLPRLGDRYFQSRLISDMAQRAHSVQILRTVPPLAASVLRSAGSLVATVAGIAWFFPQARLQAILCGCSAAAIPLLAQPWLIERDLRFREYNGALSRFYLDALLGIVPIRVHGAGPSLRRSQSNLLANWAAAGLRMQRGVVAVEALQNILTYATAAWLVFVAMRSGQSAALILLVYWALSIPELGRAIAASAWQWPGIRNNLLRLLEPLGAPEEALVAPASDSGQLPTAAARIEMRKAAVAIGGHPILHDLNLTIRSGEHIGIVGLSGAGKSSLVGLLLGWYQVSSGTLEVDGQPLTAGRLRMLRHHTVWVDPQVQLWNHPLIDNLRYGLSRDQPLELGRVIESANLGNIIQSLPHGLQTPLGEGGALLSGGEGQRVRMARGFAKRGVRLSILDEPARGLDRGMRDEFIARARETWKDATLLCITHDVSSTKVFPRVLVIENGAIVEDGDPTQLHARADSRYRQLCDREDQVRQRLWNGATWRRLIMERGQLKEHPL